MDVITRFRHTYRDLCQVEPDALNKLYTDDVVFIDPITTHRGLPQVQEYFSNLLVHANSCEFDISDILECKSKTSQTIKKQTLRNQPNVYSIYHSSDTSISSPRDFSAYWFTNSNHCELCNRQLNTSWRENNQKKACSRVFEWQHGGRLAAVMRWNRIRN